MPGPPDNATPPQLRILVVDDSATMRVCLVQLLGKLFPAPQVWEAQGGLEALELAGQRRPQLVISDLVMPDLDGRQLLLALRRSPGGARLPVLLVSGEGFDPADPDIRPDPFLRTLEKPFLLEDLRAALAGLLPLPTP